MKTEYVALLYMWDEVWYFNLNKTYQVIFEMVIFSRSRILHV